MKHACFLALVFFTSFVAAGSSASYYYPAGGLPNGLYSAVYLPSIVSNEYYFFYEAGFSGYGDAIDAWFTQFLDGTPFYQGGFEFLTAPVYPGPGDNFYVFEGRSDPINGISLEASIRVDNSGWAVGLFEFTNENSVVAGGLFHNNGYDNVGADSNTVIFSTSSGDTLVSAGDTWVLGVDLLGNDPYVAFSFGEYLDDLYQSSIEYFGWEYYALLDPGETIAFLTFFGVADPIVESAAEFGTRVASFLNDGSSVYDYTTPFGLNLLSHLSTAQLGRVVNWNLFAGGVGGDPHGKHFDGTPFELPHIGAAYCLYHDDEFQLNIFVDLNNFVTEVVAFDKRRDWTIHARINSQDHPEYLLNGELLEIPTSLFRGKLTTHSGAFKHPGPLGELVRYHENYLVLLNRVTIVGGRHPQVGGFFNVQTKQRSQQVSFPSILQLHGQHGTRENSDEQVLSSLLPDVWFLA